MLVGGGGGVCVSGGGVQVEIAMTSGKARSDLRQISAEMSGVHPVVTLAGKLLELNLGSTTGSTTRTRATKKCLLCTALASAVCDTHLLGMFEGKTVVASDEKKMVTKTEQNNSLM